MDHILSQINPEDILTAYRISILILTTHLRLEVRNGLLPFSLPTKILYAFLMHPMRATNDAHLTVPNFITLIKCLIHLIN